MWQPGSLGGQSWAELQELVWVRGPLEQPAAAAVPRGRCCPWGSWCGAGGWICTPRPEVAPAQGRSCPRSVSACKLTDEACFILYEFWQDVTSWRRLEAFLLCGGGGGSGCS